MKTYSKILQQRIDVSPAGEQTMLDRSLTEQLNTLMLETGATVTSFCPTLSSRAHGDGIRHTLLAGVLYTLPEEGPDPVQAMLESSAEPKDG